MLDAQGARVYRLKRKRDSYIVKDYLEPVSKLKEPSASCAAVIGKKMAKDLGARRIVFDALDIVLALLPDAAAKRRETYHPHEWLTANGLTALITAKAGGDEARLVP